MAEQNEQRRLAAIFAADMVEYSRLMEADERSTIARQKAHRAELIDPKIAEHHGRIVKTTGDGMLVEFASVVDAVECAVSIQRAMVVREEGVPEDHRIQYRVGINLGDIVIDGDDIFGNGVNIAARLEAIADPDGICISRTAYDQLKQTVNVGYQYLGEQQVKNIQEPVQVYRVLLDTADAGKVIDHDRKSASSSQVRTWAAAAALVLLVVGGALWWIKPWTPEFELASKERMAFTLPDKPSIAILPFNNISDDPKLNFLTEGITEDLTAALAKVSGLFVISRNSAATYKGKPVKVKQVAEELGVQYVLEGSVQKAGEKLRITAQVIDALVGNHIWAERFDRERGDLFALQDDIAKRVLVALQVKLTDGDHALVASRGTENLEAWLLRVEAISELFKWNREGHARALQLFQAAHEKDPNWARPLGGMATVHWYAGKRGWSTSRDESFTLAKQLAERAIAVDPEDPIGYQLLGNVLFSINQPERAIEVRRKAIELAPNDFSTLAGFATRLNEIDQGQKAVELFERAIRVAPIHPWWVDSGYGLALHLVGRKDEAVEAYEKAIALNPKDGRSPTRLAAVYVDLGRMDEAKAAAEKVLGLVSFRP